MKAEKAFSMLIMAQGHIRCSVRMHISDFSVYNSESASFIIDEQTTVGTAAVKRKLQH